MAGARAATAAMSAKAPDRFRLAGIEVLLAPLKKTL
jgi:hypothetical protein